MEAMVVSARCPLVGAALTSTVTSSRFVSSKSSSSALTVTGPRFVRIFASSSSPPPPVESSSPPVESSAESTSSTAPESPTEPESASIGTLEIPPPPPATSTSLVSRTQELVQPEGAAGLVKVNHYSILKVPYGSSSDEVFQAYKDRVAEVKSLGSELSEEAAQNEIATLQASYDILSSEEQRNIYDWVLGRYENSSADSYIWPYQTDITQRSTNKEPAPVMMSFDQEGNNRVGLFLLVWVGISIIFGVTMKTWVPYPHYRDL